MTDLLIIIEASTRTASSDKSPFKAMRENIERRVSKETVRLPSQMHLLYENCLGPERTKQIEKEIALEKEWKKRNEEAEML